MVKINMVVFVVQSPSPFWLCNPMNCSVAGFPVFHYLPEFAQTHVHWVSDAIQPSHPVTPFSSCPQLFLASGSFAVSWLFASGGQRTGASASVLPMMLLKCCTWYASKFGELSSDHRTGKGQFSFQSQRKAMPKNVQITIQLHSFHMLARLCSKSFKLGFSSTWTQNFQMYKLDLEKAEEPEIKLPTSAGSHKKQGNSKNTLLMLHWLCKSLWRVQFSRSVVSDSLQPHGVQHARLRCPSPTPGAYSNSCLSRQWCHPNISSSLIPFSSCLQSFPPSGSFKWVSSSHQVTRVLEFQYWSPS